MDISSRFSPRRLGLTFGLLSGALLSNTLLAAPLLIPKPAPLNSIGQEGGRSVAVTGAHSLMGAYKLHGGHNDSSGGAYLFANGTNTLLQTFSLPASVDIIKRDGTPCTMDSTAGALMGERVAMSDQWVALDANNLGVQLSPVDPTGTCGTPVPTVFLARRNTSGSQPYGGLTYTVPTPDDGHVRGLAVSNDSLVMMTTLGAYVYNFNGTTWVLNNMLKGHSSYSIYKAPLAIDDSKIVMGDPDTTKVRLFTKVNGNWGWKSDYTSTRAGFGKAVDVSGNTIIVASDTSTEFLTVSSQNNISLTYRDTTFAGGSVAVSGRNAFAGGGSGTNTTKYYYQNGIVWRSAGHIAGIDELATANNYAWSPDDIDIAGSATLAGWRGYNSPAGHQLIGAVIYNKFPGPFAVVPVVDNAEHERVWASTGSVQWQRYSGSTPSAGTGPAGGASSTFYYYVETSSGSASAAGNTATLQTELFDPSGKRLDFDYHMHGDDIGTLYLDVQLQGSWINGVWSKSGGVASGSATPAWSHYTYALADLAGMGDVRVRLRYVTAGGWRGDIGLDNLVISRN